MTGARTTYRLEDLSWPDAQAAIQAGAMAVIPVGSLEQHGRHLAINTDNVLGDAIAEAAVREASDRGLKVLLCPPLHYGYTMHNMDFPGTMTLRAETLLAVGVDLVTSLAHHGCRRIVLLNSHGSNWSILDLIARDVMNRRPEVLVAAIFPIKMAAAELERLREAKQTGGMSHGCELETSLMLHLTDLTDMSQATAADRMTSRLRTCPVDPYGPGKKKVYLSTWFLENSKHGALGDPTPATREFGKKLFDSIVAGLTDVIEEFYAAQVAATRRKPRRKGQRF